MKRIMAAVIAALLVAAVAVAADSDAIKKKQLKDLLVNASTPQDHRKLAAHYETKAKQYEAEAAEHAEMATTFRAHPTPSETKRPGSADTAAHCESMAENLGKAAKEARAMASMHEELAKK
jgi:hypothetical protein